MIFENFVDAIRFSETELLDYGQDVDVGRWQGYPTAGKPDLITKEILDLRMTVPVYNDLGILKEGIKPNLPWADDHFKERVSRRPTNPGDEYKNWPWWRGQDDLTLTHGRGPTDPKFTHTYQERFWPKNAGDGMKMNLGIRYPYGDLDDVVQQLLKEPYGRQAYFPIWFPEDTGAVHGGRVPCSLGYHFLLRRGDRGDQLHLWYDIRSCDLVRHFRDDLYLACRLLLWVLNQCQGFKWFWCDVTPGNLYFSAHSFHVHYGDLHHVKS